MPVFRVGVAEINYRYYNVTADDEDEARNSVFNREECIMDLEDIEYSHDLPPESWSVELIGNYN